MHNGHSRILKDKSPRGSFCFELLLVGVDLFFGEDDIFLGTVVDALVFGVGDVVGDGVGLVKRYHLSAGLVDFKLLFFRHG